MYGWSTPHLSGRNPFGSSLNFGHQQLTEICSKSLRDNSTSGSPLGHRMCSVGLYRLLALIHRLVPSYFWQDPQKHVAQALMASRWWQPWIQKGPSGTSYWTKVQPHAWPWWKYLSSTRYPSSKSWSALHHWRQPLYRFGCSRFPRTRSRSGVCSRSSLRWPYRC